MKAENDARELLAKRYLDKDEKFITELFHGEFRASVKEANATGGVSDAFVRDVRSAFPHLAHSSDLYGFASGISASTTLHPGETESRTGGDLGILLIRPNITESTPAVLDVDANYRRGLLCQAKIKRRGSKKRKSHWGEFSQKQKTILPGRLAFLSLLLYEYTDGERRKLAPFHWQLCRDVEFQEVKNWLRTGRFPDLITSDKLISLLASAEIGTHNREIIDQCISPPVRDTLVVKIGWPPGQEPPSSFNALHSEQQKQHVHLYQ